MGTYCERQQASWVTFEILHLAVLIFHASFPKFDHNEHDVYNCALLLGSDLSAAICEITFVIALDTYFIASNSIFSQIWSNGS